MGRYIVRYAGEGSRPAADVQRIRASRGLNVLDDSSRMMLVEASAKKSQELDELHAGLDLDPGANDPSARSRPRPRRRPKS